MSTPILFVVVSIVLALLFVLLALRRNRGLGHVEQAVQAIRSLDIEAFRTLMDPDEDTYLHEHLPDRMLKKIRRERSRVALLYMKELSAASLQFARIGDTARRSPDPVVASWGKEIANSAIYLRLRTLETIMQLQVSVTFPSLQPHRLRPLLEQYDRASHLLLQRSAGTRTVRRAS